VRKPLNTISLKIILFAVLALVAVTPLSSVAQAATVPAGATGQAASGQPSEGTDVNGLSAQPGHEKAEEKEDDNVYRHTPMVQSVARTFHMDVETTARLFEFINFAIIALAILIPLVKILPKHLRKRRETLSQNLETARKTTTDANSRLSAVEAQLARLDDEIAKIRAQVEEESKNDEVRIKATIEEESARIVAAAEQEIGIALSAARRGLRHFAADLAIDQAIRQMDLTPETDQALIAQFVTDTTGKAGQN